ncbi:MAG: hypothetical protein JW860_04500 [Sedimentisphaerales bacterium]|nr:hypothetical protein [Sedimentisphaerales bacterium]
MISKWLKTGFVIAVIALLAGGLFFGQDMVSYMRSSARSVQSAVKDNVPIEFELRRAKDTLEEIIPEMYGNIRLIAQEEVEIANIKADIAQSERSLTDEKAGIAKLRDTLDIHTASYTFGSTDYSREQVKEELSRRFERFKEAELVLASKMKLLEAREKSLASAIQLLERTRSQKRLLEDKIEGLTSQYRLLQASAVGSSIQVDSSKLAQTEKIIQQIQKRLDVAERVLAHESKFVETIELENIDEADLVTQIDEYFSPVPKVNSPEVIKETGEVCKVENSL